jgi:hypothetical protein
MSVIRIACITAFTILMFAFLAFWRWFIYGHQASFAEWTAAIAIMVAVGLWLDRSARIPGCGALTGCVASGEVCATLGRMFIGALFPAFAGAPGAGRAIAPKG